MSVKVSAKRAVASLVHGMRPSPVAAGFRCLNYHSIVPDFCDDPMQMTTPVGLLDEQMGLLASEGYHVEPTATLIERQSRGEGVDPKTIALTFDDGFVDFYERALPILSKYQFSATLFLIEAAVNEDHARLQHDWSAPYLNWSQVREIASSGLVQFGCHSATHRRLYGLSDQVLHQEIDEAKQRLEEGLRCAVKLFAYPFGNFGTWDDSAHLALKRAGFIGAFTTIAGFNTAGVDPFLLRRSRVSWCEGITELRHLLSGAYDWYRGVQRLQAALARRSSQAGQA